MSFDTPTWQPSTGKNWRKSETITKQSGVMLFIKGTNVTKMIFITPIQNVRNHGYGVAKNEIITFVERRITRSCTLEYVHDS